LALDIATTANRIGVIVTPGANSMVEWSIIGQVTRRID
jgi:hypothetical protein